MVWQEQAACRGMPTDTFFPDEADQEGHIAALAVCLRCRVKTECAADAIRRDEREGIWGGLTADQRDIAAHRTPRLPRWKRRRQRCEATGVPEGVPHNDTTYKVYRCRCDACRADHARYTRDLRARRSASA